MNKILGYTLFFIGACLPRMVSAQASAFEPLPAGAPVPDLELNEVLNYDSETVRLSDFQGKLLILDFWTYSCSVCLKTFPHLQQLQQQFGSRVVIFPVSFGPSKEKVRRFLDKRKAIGQDITLPTAVVEGEDHPLQELFPTDGYPNIVWIDATGKLVAVTSSLEVTAGNIQTILEGESPAFMTAARQRSFSRSMPLLVANNGGPDTAFRYRSMITGYRMEIKGYGLTRERNAERTRLLVVNAPLVDLVKTAVYRARLVDVRNKQLVLETANPDKWLLPPRDSNFFHRMDTIAYCYELTLPPAFIYEEAFSWMLEDLCRYFRITATVEKRPQRCWVLQCINGSRKMVAKGGRSQHLSPKEDWVFKVRNNSMQLLVSFLNKTGYPLIVDETSLTERIDIDLELPGRLELVELNRQLKSYGLVVKDEERLIDMLVIREK